MLAAAEKEQDQVLIRVSHQTKNRKGARAMIVISRLAGEAVVLGNEITVTVVQVEGDEVLLHIEAPEGSQLECGEDLAAFPLASNMRD